MTEPTLALIGPGRAGTTVALALMGMGYRIVAVAGRAPDASSTLTAAAVCDAHARLVSDVGIGAQTLIVATPDHAIEQAALTAADALEPNTLVVHLSGAKNLDVFDTLIERRPDVRVASLHPLQTLPSTSEGLDRLPGSYAVIAGDAEIERIADLLEVKALRVDPMDRVRDHAAAVVASNHIVALLGQVQRLALSAGVPFEAFQGLVEASVENAFDLGPSAALTGPVARGDLKTIEDHLRALDPVERDSYRSLAREASRLVARRDDALDRLLNDLKHFDEMG